MRQVFQLVVIASTGERLLRREFSASAAGALAFQRAVLRAAIEHEGASVQARLQEAA